MKIGIDLDNVLNNMCQALLKLYNKDAQDNLCLGDVTEYTIDNFVKEDWKDRIHLYFTDDLLLNNVEPLKDCQKYVKEIIEKGHEVFVVTSSHLYDMPTKYKWLKRKFPFINKNNIITIHDKTLLNIDVLIDDYHMNLINGTYKKILLDYPWNRIEGIEKLGIIRCYTWEDIYKTIVGLSCNKQCTDSDCLRNCAFSYDDDEAIYCEGKGGF